MKAWIYCIFFVYNRLNALCGRIEEEIEAASCDLRTDTIKLFEGLLALNDKKVRVINLKVLGKLLKDKLSIDELKMLKLSVNGASVEEIATAFDFSKSTVFRKLRASVKKCGEYLEGIGFNAERLEKEYKDIPLVLRALQKFKG